MTIVQALLLGIVQGLTEFLPISSSAHLVFIPSLLGWRIPENINFIFDVLVQVGTLAAVVVYFRRDLGELISAMTKDLIAGKPFKTNSSRLGWFVILATIPAGIFGLLVKPAVEKAFSDPRSTALMLVLTGLFLFFAEKLGKQKREVDSIGWVDAILIGLAQALAVFPGISRSGATISAGMGRNFKREGAARFSFLLSVPIIAASIVVGIKDLFQISGIFEYLPQILIGILSAGLAGFFCIRWLLRYLSRHSLNIFSIYCLAVALFMLIYIHVS